MVGDFKVKILNRQFRQAFSTVDWRAYFWIGLQNEGGQAKAGCMEGSRTPSRAGSNHHDVVHALASFGNHGTAEALEENGNQSWSSERSAEEIRRFKGKKR
jgi:hypothetical protein